MATFGHRDLSLDSKQNNYFQTGFKELLLVFSQLSKDQNGLREHEDYLEPKFLWVIISTANF